MRFTVETHLQISFHFWNLSPPCGLERYCVHTRVFFPLTLESNTRNHGRTELRLCTCTYSYILFYSCPSAHSFSRNFNLEHNPLAIRIPRAYSSNSVLLAAAGCAASRGSRRISTIFLFSVRLVLQTMLSFGVHAEYNILRFSFAGLWTTDH